MTQNDFLASLRKSKHQPRRATPAPPSDLERLERKAEAQSLHKRRREEFEVRYLPLYLRVLHFTLSMTHNWADAEDITQDTFLQTMRRIDEGFEGRSPHAVLITQTKLLVLNRFYSTKTHAGGRARRRLLSLEEWGIADAVSIKSRGL